MHFDGTNDRRLPPLLVVFPWFLAGVLACGDDGGLPNGDSECTPSMGGAPATSDGLTCATGEVCLAISEEDGFVRGRCYPACRGDGDCPSDQMCNPSTGTCVLRTEPRTDAGAPDTGPVDPCAAVECASPNPLCHPATQECVVCTPTDSSRCGVATGPICDVAFGQCASVTPQVCSPCASDADCMPGTRCEMRNAPFERVCLAECDEIDTTCPQGTKCDTEQGRCFPLGSCTNFLSGLLGRGCNTDSDCLAPNTVMMVAPCIAQGDGGTPTCRQPCLSDFPCPAGFVCDYGPAGGQYCFPE